MTSPMSLRTLPANQDIQDQTVLVRLDLNIPVHQGQPDLSANWRLQAAVPSIKNLLSRGAKVVIIAHLGEPTGVDSSLSLQPVVTEFSKLLQQDILWLPYDPITQHSALVGAISTMQPGDVACLENLRFNPGETANDPDFAQHLASLADIFINDAFGVCHRSHASMVSLATLLPTYAGPLLDNEVSVISSLLSQPKSPFLALLAGAKLTTKLPTINQLLVTCDQVLLAGAMANAVLAARGFSLGRSLPSTDEIAAAKEIAHHPKLLLPVDVVVTKSDTDSSSASVSVSEIGADQYVYDVGPTTLELFSAALSSAKSIVWNGPLGKFETKPFDHGTKFMASLLNQLGQQGCFVVAGGGETLAAIEQTGTIAGYAHRSTGGGAMLALLAGEDLPGLQAITNAGVLP